MAIILNRVNKVRSLRVTLALVCVMIGITPLIIFVRSSERTLENHYIQDTRNRHTNEAAIIASRIDNADYLTDYEKAALFDFDVRQLGVEGGYRLIVADARGIIMADSNERGEQGRTYLLPVIVDALDGNQGFLNDRQHGLMYVTTPVVNAATGNVIGAVLISVSTDEIYSTLLEIRQQNYRTIILFSLTVAVIGFFASKFIVDPIRKILEVIQRMSEGHLDQRLEIKGHTEMAELAFSFNLMADKLQQVEETRQNFVSNVSHELKTPLSSMKVLSESLLFQDDVPVEMYKEFLQDINSEIDRMADIIEDLLSLVRLGQKEIPLNLKTLSLNKFIGETLKRLYPLAEKKDIELAYEPAKDVEIEADEMKLTLGISNIIENGIKYTNPGGTVKVTVDADHQNAFITVQDTGVGIPEKDVANVFERFYRVDENRARETGETGGTGLGLSITHSVVLLHNGSIKVTSKEEVGSTFVVRLPIKQ